MLSGSQIEGGMLVEGADSAARVQGGCIEENAASPVIARSGATAHLIGVKIVTSDARADEARALTKHTSDSRQSASNLQTLANSNARGGALVVSSDLNDDTGSVRSVQTGRSTRPPHPDALDTPKGDVSVDLGSYIKGCLLYTSDAADE